MNCGRCYGWMSWENDCDELIILEQALETYFQVLITFTSIELGEGKGQCRVVPVQIVKARMGE